MALLPPNEFISAGAGASAETLAVTSVSQAPRAAASSHLSDSGVPFASMPDEAAALTRSHAPGAAAEIHSSCGGVEGHARFINPNTGLVTLADCDGPSAQHSGHPGAATETVGINPDPQGAIDSKHPLLAAIEDDYRFVLNEEKFLFDIGCVPEDFAKYMAMMEGLVDHDEPPLFIQQQRRA